MIDRQRYSNCSGSTAISLPFEKPLEFYRTAIIKNVNKENFLKNHFKIQKFAKYASYNDTF